MANSRNYSNIANGKLNVTGKIVEKYRKQSKLSRQALSNKLILIGIDISSSSIYDIEKGLRTLADYEICAISKVLKLPADALLIDYYNSLDELP